MHIEVWQGKGRGPNPSMYRGGWYWHFRASNGKVTADSEAFPTRAHAIRAAKAVVRGVVKRTSSRIKVRFDQNEAGTRIDWIQQAIDY